MPEQAPPQAPKVEFASGVAVSCTIVPEVKSAVQVVPQFTPAGTDRTAPPAEPTFENFCTVNRCRVPVVIGRKVADTV